MPEFSIEFWVTSTLAVMTLVIGLGVTLAMDAKTRGEYLFATGCFVCSAAMIATTIVMWGTSTEALMAKRIVITAVCFAVLGIALIESLRWTRTRHVRASGSSRSEDVGTAVNTPVVSSPLGPSSVSPANKIGIKHPTVNSEQEQPSVIFSASLQPDEPYPQGTVLAGIVWRDQYVDVRVDIANGPTDVKNLDFIVHLDTSIAGVGQISQFPGFTAFPYGSDAATWIEGTDAEGKPTSLPITPIEGAMRISPAYRVRCSEVFANTVVHLAVASIAMNAFENGQMPQHLFAPRRPPKIIKVKGKYETRDGRFREVEFDKDFMLR